MEESNRSKPSDVLYYMLIPQTLKDKISKHFYIREIFGEGNCVFNALSYGIYQNEDKTEVIKKKVFEHISENWNIYKSRTTLTKPLDYNSLSINATYGNHLELQAATVVFNIFITLYLISEDRTIQIGKNNQNVNKMEINLLYYGILDSGYYHALIPKTSEEKKVERVTNSKLKRIVQKKAVPIGVYETSKSRSGSNAASNSENNIDLPMATGLDSQDGTKAKYFKTRVTYQKFLEKKRHERRETEDALEINANIKKARETLKLILVAVGAIVKVGDKSLSTDELLRLANIEWETPFSQYSSLFFDVTSAISDSFIAAIKSELLEVPFVSILIDELPDKRISVIFRFVDYKGEITERFIGYENFCIDQKTILERLRETYSLDTNLVCVLVGRTSSIESLLTIERATVLHSPVYKISQVIPSCLEHVKECIGFFQIVNGLLKWVELLPEELISRTPLGESADWKERIVETVYKNQDIVLEVLREALLKPDSNGGMIYIISMGLEKAFDDVEFRLLLAIFGELFPLVDNLQDTIATASPNIKACLIAVRDCIAALQSKKKTFHDLWESVQRSERPGPASKKRRLANSSKLVGYYEKMFTTIVDTIVCQVSSRFSSLSCLEYTSLLDGIDAEKDVESMRCLREGGCDEFNLKQLKNELSVVYSHQDFKGMSVEELLKCLYYSGFCKHLGEVTQLCRYLLANPYATAGGKYDSLRKLNSAVNSCPLNVDLPTLPVLKVQTEMLDKLIAEYDFFETFCKFLSRKCCIELQPYKLKKL